MPRVSERGFSLLELLVVIIIMGVISALALPSFSKFLENIEMRKSIRSLSSILRFARSRAIQEGASHKVNFEEKGLWVSKEDRDGRYIRLEGKRGANIILPELEVAPLSEGNEASITFYPKGTSSGGEIILEVRNEQAYRITVERITGKIRVEKIDEVR